MLLGSGLEVSSHRCRFTVPLGIHPFGFDIVFAFAIPFGFGIAFAFAFAIPFGFGIANPHPLSLIAISFGIVFAFGFGIVFAFAIPIGFVIAIPFGFVIAIPFGFGIVSSMAPSDNVDT
jgi:hypothetical protein